MGPVGLSDPVSSVVYMNSDTEPLERLGDPVSVVEIETFMARLAVASPAGTDEERIDRIAALEGLKSSAAAAQAGDLVSFADSQLDDQANRGVLAKDRGRGIASQIGLACRHSPHRASRLLSTARALLADLPETLEALRRGKTTEFRATLVAKETAILDDRQRRRVDAELGPRLHELGDRAVEAEARRWACRLAPEAVAARASNATTDRRVTIRPAPDTMTYLTGLLPVRDGVAVYAALDAAAKAAAAAGDTRSRGQVMADILVERVTGVSSAEQRVEVCVVMTDKALFGGGDEPAQVAGYGPIPAEIARRWILSILDLDADDHDDGGESQDDEVTQRHRQRRLRDDRARRHDRGRAWLRRLYTTPDGGHLVAMDSQRRDFPGMLRKLIELRDQACATPFCGAPIRHMDHITPVRSGGETSYGNGRGTCARCNLAKEAPGWSAAVVDTTTTSDGSGTGGDHPERVVTLETPTGHRYQSRPPPVHRDSGPSANHLEDVEEKRDPDGPRSGRFGVAAELAQA